MAFALGTSWESKRRRHWDKNTLLSLNDWWSTSTLSRHLGSPGDTRIATSCRKKWQPGYHKQTTLGLFIVLGQQSGQLIAYVVLSVTHGGRLACCCVYRGHSHWSHRVVIIICTSSLFSFIISSYTRQTSIIVGGSFSGLTLAHCLYPASIPHIVQVKNPDPAPQVWEYAQKSSNFILTRDLWEEQELRDAPDNADCHLPWRWKART